MLWAHICVSLHSVNIARTEWGYRVALSQQLKRNLLLEKEGLRQDVGGDRDKWMNI